MPPSNSTCSRFLFSEENSFMVSIKRICWLKLLKCSRTINLVHLKANQWSEMHWHSSYSMNLSFLKKTLQTDWFSLQHSPWSTNVANSFLSNNSKSPPNTMTSLIICYPCSNAALKKPTTVQPSSKLWPKPNSASKPVKSYKNSKKENDFCFAILIYQVLNETIDL